VARMIALIWFVLAPADLAVQVKDQA
jgi:hypothetical protein